MSLLNNDKLTVTLSRTIRGEVHLEQIDIAGSDVQFFPTPMLLRHFVAQIDRAKQRLDAIEEFGAAGDTTAV